MPLYTWKCAKCGKTIDILRSVSDFNVGPDDVCPHCQATEEEAKWEKIIHPTINRWYYCDRKGG